MNPFYAERLKQLVANLFTGLEENDQGSAPAVPDLEKLVDGLVDRFRETVPSLIETGNYASAKAEVRLIHSTARINLPRIAQYSGGLNYFASIQVLKDFLELGVRDLDKLCYAVTTVNIFSSQLKLAIKSGNIIGGSIPQQALS